MFSKEITNLPSIVYSNNNNCKIIVNLEFDTSLKESFIDDYIKKIVNNNSILRSKIEKKDNKFFLIELEDFDINKKFLIKKTSYNNFDKELDYLINNDLENNTKWFLYICIDEENNKSRIYFKIDHSYADGYQIIKILTSPFSEIDNTVHFKRQTTFLNKIYYFLYGTLYLLISFIIYVIKSFFNYYFINYSINNNNTDGTEFIQESFDFDIVKEYTKRKNITINDFFYAIMVKSNNNYTGINQKISCISPINISNLEDINNMLGLYVTIDNDLNNKLLTTKIHEIFNTCKYSVGFILLSYLQKSLFNIFGESLILKLYDIFISNVEYCYTNVIGPDFNKIKKLGANKVSFFSKVQKKEICFNIISFNNKLNMNICFRKGFIKDKEKFKNSIKNAFDDIINN